MGKPRFPASILRQGWQLRPQRPPLKRDVVTTRSRDDLPDRHVALRYGRVGLGDLSLPHRSQVIRMNHDRKALNGSCASPALFVQHGEPDKAFEFGNGGIPCEVADLN